MKEWIESRKVSGDPKGLAKQNESSWKTDQHSWPWETFTALTSSYLVLGFCLKVTLPWLLLRKWSIVLLEISHEGTYCLRLNYCGGKSSHSKSLIFAITMTKYMTEAINKRSYLNLPCLFSLYAIQVAQSQAIDLFSATSFKWEGAVCCLEVFPPDIAWWHLGHCPSGHDN